MTIKPNVRNLASLIAITVMLGVVSTSAQAREKLKVGSSAPASTFSGAKLVSGKAPPSSFEKGKTYVVEFWATWCGPCLKSIPHLNDLSKQLKRSGVQFMGISDESASKVSAFVKKKGDGMSYTVIADAKGGYNKAYMKAAGARGIPTAFIVGPSGKIAFIGHPMSEEFEKVLLECSGGKYDPELMKSAQPMLDGADRSITTRDWNQAHRQLDKVLELDPWVFSDVMIQKYKLMLNDQGDQEMANAYLRQQINVYADKPDVLTDIVILMINDPDVPKGNMEIANEAVSRVAMAQGEGDPQVLELIALVSYHQGDINGAVDKQFKAWMAADADYKPEMKRVLDKYKAEQAKSRGGKGTRGGGRR
ncbi:MAG: TlpA disulfide reductase family protein [Phycisphaerales bacterium]|jgi:thiol-disulfide isomerase/thioredoxin|nr:TlpA disulfide reductase family protein [Phycisphaerales bacterium]